MACKNRIVWKRNLEKVMKFGWKEKSNLKNLLWSLCGLSGFLSSLGSLSEPDSVLALRCNFFILARWFWNQTCTTLTLSPVSLAKASRTLRHGFGETSNDALNWRLWTDVRIVLGRFGPRLPSRGLLSSSKSSSVNDVSNWIFHRWLQCINYLPGWFAILW